MFMNCTDSSIVLPLTYALQDMALWSFLLNISCVVLGMALAYFSRAAARFVDSVIESRRSARSRAVHDFLDGATVVDFGSPAKRQKQ